MLTFQDFVPEMTGSPGFLSPAQFETFEAAVAAADRWVTENDIDLVNVETVVLPNMWSPHEENSTDASLRTSGDFQATWHQFVRIWYRAAQPEFE